MWLNKLSLFLSNNIINLLELLLITLYVIYTRRTFIEIKKQTDSQIDAQITVDKEFFQDLDKIENDEILQIENHDEIKEPAKDWRDRIIRLFNLTDTEEEDTLLIQKSIEGNYLTFKIKNYGQTPLKRIEVKGKLTVQCTDRTKEKDAGLKHSIDYPIEIEADHYLEKGKRIILPIMSVNQFPKYDFDVDIQWMDIKDKEYKPINFIISGENLHI